jgi:hypothetical protein
VKTPIITAVLALLVLPATADAFSVHDYRVRDAGAQIVHSVTVCDPYIRSAPLRLRSTHETADGSDRQQYYTTAWMGRGCTRVGIWYRDQLRFEGHYYGRMRVRLLGASGFATRRTGWRRFWSS